MLRVVYFLAMVTGFIGMAAYHAEDPKSDHRPFPANSTLARVFPADEGFFPAFDEMLEADSTVQVRVLMLNTSAYDNAYPKKTHRFIQTQLPAATITDFWDVNPENLAAALIDQQVAVVTYPANGDSATLISYGKTLEQFIRKGGTVIFTGTDHYNVLKQFGLFDLEYGYYCDKLAIHELVTDHPLFAGTPSEFNLDNFAYPLDVSDPAFVPLADINGYPVMGYKPLGAGKIIYIGFEFYFHEAISSRILANAVHWCTPPALNAATADAGREKPRALKRSEEILYAGGSKKTEQVDLKIYPNPYVYKASLDLNLTKNSTVAVEMTDETGRTLAVILPRKNLNAGAYRFDLPNLEPGVYFVHCNTGDNSTVRKVVKIATP